MSNIKQQKILLLTISVIAIMTFCLFLFGSIRDIRLECIQYLPLVYGLCTLFYCFGKIQIFRTIILLCFSISFLFLPSAVLIYNGFNLSDYNQKLFDYLPDAVFLQSAELISITLFLSFFKTQPTIVNKIRFKKNIPQKVNRILMLMFCASLALLVIYPQILFKFEIVIYGDHEDFVAHQVLSESVKSSVPMLVYHLGTWLIYLSKLLLLYFFIIKIYYDGKGWPWPKIGLSILIIFLSCLFVTSDKAATIYTAIIAFFLLQKLYASKAKAIMRILMIGGGLGILYIFIIVPITSKGDSSGVIMYKLNAYFAGVFNVAASFLMDVPNTAEYLLGDFLRNIPLVMGFFTSMPMSYIEFNRVLGYDVIYNSQILPVVGQGYFYLGFIGGILFPLLMLFLAIKLYDKWQTATDSYSYFIFGVNLIYLVLGIFLYDMFLTMSLILQYGLPMYVIMRLSKIGHHEKSTTVY